jgi:hypothetical protein
MLKNMLAPRWGGLGLTSENNSYSIRPNELFFWLNESDNSLLRIDRQRRHNSEASLFFIDEAHRPQIE